MRDDEILNQGRGCEDKGEKKIEVIIYFKEKPLSEKCR